MRPDTSANLGLQTRVGMVATPRMQQSLRILQYSGAELTAFVMAELDRNPLLQCTGNDPFRDRVVATGHPGFADAGERVADRPSLQTHLLAQARVVFGGRELAIAEALIGAVEPDGYLRSGLDEATAGLDRVGAREIAPVLERLQGFDPPGVFARDLTECLTLQLRAVNRCDPAMAALLQNLDLLARGDLAALQRQCGVDAEDLREMIGEVRALDPRPGSRFEWEPVQPLMPDVIVREGAEGAWVVALNPKTVPGLQLDQDYYDALARQARGSDDRAFIAACASQANALIRNIELRGRTILKVAQEVVRQQQTFLEQGIEALRPLRLRDVAEALKLHESTVSRVTSNKYIATPRGVFELKSFFSWALHSTAGEATHSAKAVKGRIRSLIEAERAAEAVRSDDCIVAALRGAGIEIARRTVTKYREAMRIPSSVERRRALKARR